MKRLTTLSLIALAAAAMIAIPVDAQTRGGSSSRSGSGGSSSRSSGGSRPSSSMSSQSRGHSSAGNTKGLGSAQRSSQPSYSSHSSSQPSRPSGSSQVSRSGSNSRSSSSVTRQTPSVGSSTKSSGTTVRQQTPSAGTQSRTAQPARSGSNVRSSSNGGTVVRQNRVDPGQPGGSINRNQPQPGMSVNSGAPRTVRSRTSAPRNFNGGIGPSHVQMHPGPGHNMERIPPYRRDPMPYGRAVRFWDGGHHYFGYRVSYLPPRYERRVYWGVPYYCLDGIYYRHYHGHYYVSRPPFGVYFDPVLDGVIYNACRFSYYYNVYNTYRTIDENARIITSQNETIAANNATIARQNADIALNTERAAKSFKEADRLGLVQSYADAGVEYFYQDGVFFIKNSEGKYVTIVPPTGALVQELPDDYETIVLEGEEYYKVDDTVYRLTIVDGSPYFEVLGQMTGQLAEKYNQYNTL